MSDATLPGVAAGRLLGEVVRLLRAFWPLVVSAKGSAFLAVWQLPGCWRRSTRACMTARAHRSYRLMSVLTGDVDTVSAFTFNFSGYAIALATTIGSFAPDQASWGHSNPTQRYERRRYMTTMQSGRAADRR